MILRHGCCRLVTILAALMLLAPRCFAQRSLSVFDIDVSRFPTVSAKVYAIDDDGNRLDALSAADFRVIENGTTRIVSSVTCQTPGPPEAISSVLAIDVSTSMEDSVGNGPPKIDIAKQAASAWVNTMPLTTSECAITSFDNVSYLNQDFTNNRSLLLGAVNGLTTQGASDFDAALLRAPGGALQVAARGRHRRIVVLITDGIAAGTESTIVQTALDNNVAIYCITLTVKSPDLLKNIAEKTGGAWFENVNTAEDALAIYKRILLQAQELPPCTIVWQSTSACSLTRRANVIFRNGQMSDSAIYQAPESSVPLAIPSPEGVEFGPVIPTGFRSSTITITARGGDLTIDDITIANPRFTLVPKPEFPISLMRGGSIQVTARFTPTDSAYTYGKLVIISNACSFSVVHLTGGFPGHPGSSTLYIDKPNGGETYNAGIDTIITWGGIQPTDAVRLEYSTDNGGSWKDVTPSAKGLRYLWRVPNTPSNRCLVRGTHILPRAGDTAIVFRGAHTAGTYSADFSPDGKLVVTASDDKTAKIWNVATAQPIKSFDAHSDWVRTVSYSPDGRWIATGSYDGTVIIWDASTGIQLRTLTGHTGWILSARFSPDSRFLVTASRDNTARLWRFTAGQLVHTYGGHKEAVTDARFSADGTKVVTASGDHTAKIWNVGDGQLFRTFSGHTDWVWSASFTPDGNQLVTGSDDNTAAIWDVASGTILRRLTDHSGPVRGVSVSPDGSLVATASDDQTSMIWNIATGARLRTLEGHQNAVRSVTFSTSGTMLLTAGLDTTARIWHLDQYTTNTDVSDRVFAIIAPALRGPDTIDFGKVAIGASKDSLLVLRNVGSFPLSIEKAPLLTNGEFSHIAGFPPVSLLPDSAGCFRYRFRPTVVGVSYATVEVVTPRGILRYILRGEGINPRIETVASVDFPSVACTSYRDTFIVIRNSGSTPLSISEMRLEGTGRSSFQINPGGGAQPMVILPGEEDTIVVRFQSTKATTAKATLMLRSDGSNEADSVTSIELKGTRDSIGFTATPKSLDFGPIDPGTSTTKTITVTNTGTLPLTWTAPIMIGAYTIESIVPATIPPIGSAVMTVRFTPPTDNASFAETYALIEPVCNGRIDLAFAGSSQALASARIEIPDLSGEQNTTIEIPVFLRDSYNLSEAGVTTVSFKIALDPAILIPIAPTPAGIVDNDERLIQVNAQVRPGDPVLAKLRFRVAAADKLTTPLKIEDVFTNGRNVTLAATSGSFTVAGICGSGGARLIDAGIYGLKTIRPNPIRSSTAIEFDLVESGHTRLWLTDATGREVAVLVDESMQSGSFSAEFDPSGIPSGVYMCHLRTPTQHDVRNVIILK